MSTPIERFYGQFGGDRLIDSSHYPPEILSYLRNEEQIITRIITDNKYNYFIEVGCMEARSLPLAVSLDIPYYGIDLVDKYIMRAQNMIRTMQKSEEGIKAEVYKVSVYDLANHLKQYPLKSIDLPTHPLIVFPFNSFGNIEDPEKAARAVSNCSSDFLILTYRTDEYSTQLRKTYYQNCGYTGTTTLTDKRGIRFISSEGLNTVAYEGSYIRRLFGPNFSIQEYPIAQIGVGYYGTRIV